MKAFTRIQPLNQICRGFRKGFASLAYSRSEAVEQPARLHSVALKSTGGQAKQTLVALHGLLGNHSNFKAILNNPSITDKTDVLLVDQRNHGQSETRDSMKPSEMARDLVAHIHELGIKTPVTLMGHSMGGIVAMTAAVLFPHLFQSVIVADIAPMDYFSDVKYFSNYLEMEQLLLAMKSVDLDNKTTMSAIREDLEKQISSFPLLKLIMGNLRKDDTTGKFKWHTDPEVFLRNLNNITAEGYRGSFDGPVKVIAGEKSDYMNDLEEIIPEFQKIFPKMDSERDISVIKGAGHWVHFDKPAAFAEEVSQFLE